METGSRMLCVFAASADGTNPRHPETARALGGAMNARGIGLVYGGAHCGLMGILADTVLQSGGRVVGVMPRALVAKEKAHQGLTELIITEDMHTRKARMVQLADAFLALPGGFGTLDELFEVLTWSQLGFHQKPIALLNSDGYWDGLLHFLASGHAQGLIPKEGFRLLGHGDTPGQILSALLPETGSPSS